MNARTTTLLTVLALTLAACVAPIQAPPIKAPQPQTEQVLIPQTEPAQNKLPVTQPSLDPWAYPDYVEQQFQQHQQKIHDEEATRLLAAQQALTNKLMIGLPEEVQPYIETYAAIQVAKAPETALPAASTYVLPEQKATNPKQPAIQELDNMLKPVTLPEDLAAARIASLESVKLTMPMEVQMAMDRYIEELKMPASTMPVRDQSYLEEQTTNALPASTLATIAQLEHNKVVLPMEVQAAIDRYIEELKLPASTLPVRDQWYLEEQTTTASATSVIDQKIAQIKHAAVGVPSEVQPAIERYIEALQAPAPGMEPWYYFNDTGNAPAKEPNVENFLNDIQHGR